VIHPVFVTDLDECGFNLGTITAVKAACSLLLEFLDVGVIQEVVLGGVTRDPGGRFQMAAIEEK